MVSVWSLLVDEWALTRSPVGRRSDPPAPPLVGGARCASERNRRLHRRQGGLRVPVRTSPTKIGESCASPARSRWRGWRRTARSASTKMTNWRRTPRRHLHRPGVRDRHPPRPGGRRPRSRRRQLRRADRLRVQLRGARHRVQQTRPHADSQGAYERRPAHVRRAQEHRQGQPVRDTSASPTSRSSRSGTTAPRRARSRSRSTAWTCSIPTPENPQRRSRRHRLLVRRYRLQREELLRPPRLPPRCQRPYKALKTTLKTEIHRDAWEILHSDTSDPFDCPASGRIAVKVINHLGDEVMKVFRT